MNNDEKDGQSSSGITALMKIVRSRKAYSVIIGLVTVLVLYTLMSPNRPLRPVQNSPPFVWPRSCPNINYQYAYNRGDRIPCACKVESNRIRDWLDRGLPNENKLIDEWYRVGDYAVGIHEDNGLLGKNGCSIMDVESNFFLSSPQAKK